MQKKKNVLPVMVAVVFSMIVLILLVATAVDANTDTDADVDVDTDTNAVAVATIIAAATDDAAAAAAAGTISSSVAVNESEEGSDSTTSIVSSTNKKPRSIRRLRSRRQRQWRRIEEDEEEAEAATDDSNYQYYYNSGYIQATGCLSYTIALDDEENDAVVSVIGQETFVFFNYVPYDAYYAADDAVDDAAAAEEAEEEEEQYDDDQQQQNYYYDDVYYGNSNGNVDRGDMVLARHWLAVYSEVSTGVALQNGCQLIQDPADLFEDYVPSIEDGTLYFPSNYLYYGPICRNGKVEIGVFLDNTCNAYIPGLSTILNKKVLSDWMTGVTVSSSSSSSNGNDDDDTVAEDDDKSYSTDLQNIYSYRTVVQQLNYYHNRDPTECATYPEICQNILFPAIDLNTCESLNEELLEKAEAEAEGNDNDEEEEEDRYIDDEQIEENAEEYGAFYEYDDEMENEEEEAEAENDDDNDEDNDSATMMYQMFQDVVTDYASSFMYYNNDDDNDDQDNNNDDQDIDYEGVCYGVLESTVYALSVGDWMDFNSESLKDELVTVYGMSHSKKGTINATTFWTEGLWKYSFVLLILVSIIAITGGLVLTIRIVRRKNKKRRQQKRKQQHQRNKRKNEEKMAALTASAAFSTTTAVGLVDVGDINANNDSKKIALLGADNDENEENKDDDNNNEMYDPDFEMRTDSIEMEVDTFHDEL